ncbi:hypothetical protein [Thetidibacter halocola]|uniref:Lipoprotein n=1 Tax=Thetidibacter halocola TaxID=2827239 RepID=A0A8J7WCL3_9RHOB|nr:hypothetical protein [Thetidibacter halocola]MBS0123216.1 hypothetical protein [Thetidibacter halocola]
MVSSSKILTVSYGTFSCTAEGFEDPLAVVKDTTHFFRSVIREDRFFGAEPPQFDPEMAGELMRAQIAAEEQGGKLTLRPAVSAASAGALAAALTAGPARRAPEPVAPEAQDTLPDDSVLETAAREAAEAATEAAEEPVIVAEAPNAAEPEIIEPQAETPASAGIAPAPRPAEPDSIAARLQRIRDVVSEQPAAEQAAIDDDAVEAAEDADFDSAALTAMLEGMGQASPAEAMPEAQARAEPADDLDDELDALIAGSLLSSVEEDEEPAEPVATTAPAMTEDPDDAWDDAEWDDELESVLGDTVRVTDEDDLLAEDDDAFDLAEDEALAEEPIDEDEIFAEAALAEGQDEAMAEDALDEDGAFAEDAIGEDLDEALAEDKTLAEDVIDEAAPAQPEEPAAIAETEQAPARPALRARVVKVKRAVFEQAIASGRIEPAEDMPAEGSLSPDEEDELARELEAVKAELDSGLDDWDEDEDSLDDAAPQAVTGIWDDADEDEEEIAPPAAAGTETDDAATSDDDWDDWDEDAAADRAAPLRLDNPLPRQEAPEETGAGSRGTVAGALDSVRKAVKMASPARAMLTENKVEDDDASRILDQTNTQLEEPEGNRRRSAIAHLRAAVAATRADKLLGRKPDAAEQTEPYREDLASVVRPRRPQTAGAVRTERPATESQRPAPLKLVAEQRVTDAESQHAAVRPRRVSVAEEPAPLPGADGGFADYAESVGARELPELLEAAAAYMSFVEGRDQFSRPQLMTTVRQAEQQEFSREDRLRSFGQLLREGKIEKTTGGRFTASDRISFKPDRKAG